MPTQPRVRRSAMYNTPAIRNGGFGALQVEAVTNRPLSIARRHLAASQLRMRDIEPDELSSSEWVRFLVMEESERERWMTHFVRRRRNSDESTTSTEADRGDAQQPSKAEEARIDAREARQREAEEGSSMGAGTTPAVSLWVRQLDGEIDAGSSAETTFTARRPMHARRAVTDAVALEAPPTYDSAMRSRTPPPAYEPRSDEEGPSSPRYIRQSTHAP